jgi:integrase
MEEIKVHVNDYGSGRNLVMLYFDPVSGKRVTKSTGTTDPGEAERAAGEWEKQLRAGLYQSPSKITWKEFRERYETEHLATLSEKTQVSAISALNHLERVLNPDRLSKVTATTLSKFQAELRKPQEIINPAKKIIKRGKEIIKPAEKIIKPGMRDTTMASHLRHIKAALSWGVSMGLLAKRPDLIMPKKSKGQTMMRGRPITTEEYERMLAACDKTRPHDAEAWKRYLTGLWLSGLRLEESLILSWDGHESFTVDYTGRRPAFRIYAEAQKAKRDTMLPMTPDFAQWLLETFPESDRHGRVFKIDGLQSGKPITPGRVGRLVSKIGEKAGVVVNKADGKYGSAHDLRRAFCTRWASKVKPATLQLLARHAEIGTTMKYYVAQDAADVADELWAGFAPKADNKKESYNTSYNTCPESPQNDIGASIEPSTETPCNHSSYESGGQGIRTLNRQAGT